MTDKPLLHQSDSGPCMYCSGKGCEECDGTGRRVITTIEDGDVRMRARGSRPLSDSDAEVLVDVMRAAYKKMTTEAS